MASAGFESTIPVTKRPQAYALYHAAIGIGYEKIILPQISWYLFKETTISRVTWKPYNYHELELRSVDWLCLDSYSAEPGD
jgi:hypothetical protein